MVVCGEVDGLFLVDRAAAGELFAEVAAARAEDALPASSRRVRTKRLQARLAPAIEDEPRHRALRLGQRVRHRLLGRYAALRRVLQGRQRGSPQRRRELVDDERLRKD